MSLNTSKSDISAYAATIHTYIKDDKSALLAATLCLLSMEERKRIVSYKVNDNTALCAAILFKRDEIIGYLIEKCGADVNENGIYHDEDSKINTVVPPLWCAAVTGQIEVAKTLLLHGADVNGWSDTESTPVRAASYCSDKPMVELLIENGADIFKTIIYGGTCLINSIRCADLTKFLIEKGAYIDETDCNGSTALHYAAKEGNVDTVTVLLKENCNYRIVNKKGWTALKMSAFNGHDSVVRVFVDFKCTTNEELKEAYELLGCHLVDTNMEKAKLYWQKAFTLHSNLPQASIQTSKFINTRLANIALANIAEFLSLEQLTEENDNQTLEMQALLLYIRVLGASHEDTIYKIRYRGAVYADNNSYQRCIDLWKFAYVLLLDKKDYLDNDTVYGATSLANIFCEMQKHWESDNTADKVKVGDILDVITILKDHIKNSEIVLQVRPRNLGTITNYKLLLQSVLHITNVFRCVERDRYQDNDFYKEMCELVSLNIKTEDGQTLLHLAVDPDTSCVDGTEFSPFPSLEVIKILLACGVDSNALDKDGNTALLCSFKYGIDN